MPSRAIMRRFKLLCPISKHGCVECPIYRGRHYLLCNRADPPGNVRKNEDTLIFSIPDDLLSCEKVIKNVEELIERSEL
jgi:hypothetical protein